MPVRRFFLKPLAYFAWGKWTFFFEGYRSHSPQESVSLLDREQDSLELEHSLRSFKSPFAIEHLVGEGKDSVDDFPFYVAVSPGSKSTRGSDPFSVSHSSVMRSVTVARVLVSFESIFFRKSMNGWLEKCEKSISVSSNEYCRSSIVVSLNGYILAASTKIVTPDAQISNYRPRKILFGTPVRTISGA